MEQLYDCPTYSMRDKNKLFSGTENPDHIGKVDSSADVTVAAARIRDITGFGRQIIVLAVRPPPSYLYRVTLP